jgi:putative membrane protein
MEEEENIVNNNVLLAGAAALALVFAGTAVAQGQKPSANKTEQQSKPATHRMSDSEFVQRANWANLAEVKLGNLAEQKATSKTIKDFGKRMVTDHSKAEDNLKSAAAKDNITLPSQLDARDQATFDRLSKLSGTAFDRAYARDMVRDHAADVAEFRHEATDGKDAAIKGFASQTLPTLEDHLKEAHEVLRNVSAKNVSHTKSTSHTGT